MFVSLRSLFARVISAIQSRGDLTLETLALQQQLLPELEGNIREGQTGDIEKNGSDQVGFTA